MDRGVRDGIVNGPACKGMAALLLLALSLVQAGCHRGERGGIAPPVAREERAGDNAASSTATEWLSPAVATKEAGEAPGVPPSDNTVPGYAAPPVPEAVAPLATSPDNVARTAASPPSEALPVAPSPAAAPASHRLKSSPAPHPADAPHPPQAALSKDLRVASPPGWAKSPEELVYRVDFIGITMGYARFRYQGKVSIAGKPAYHLNVRAWTSGVLSYIFPINETIDYYLDAESLAPIRQEFTQREKEKDDVALYDQETGKITYRYRQTGKIRKEVTTVPSVYDPVSVAYYFRWRDLGVESRPRNVYGGRKLYQISSRILGKERIRTDHGEMNTIAVLPLIRRDGKPDDKGDLKIWFSDDERRVPVRLYAKFRKIKDWTLVGELMPPKAKAGG